MERDELVQSMCRPGLLPVFRTHQTGPLMAASHAYWGTGIACIEYTMTMPGALELVRRAVAECPSGCAVGAGTIMDVATVEQAVAAGATFIAGPGCCPAVIEACHRLGVVSVAGAMTPTEIMLALQAGADIIKVFPAAAVGPAFFAEVLGPFPGTRLMAAGGISLANVGDYVRAGASVVTVLANGLAAPAYEEGRIDAIAAAAQALLAAIAAARRPN